MKKSFYLIFVISFLVSIFLPYTSTDVNANKSEIIVQNFFLTSDTINQKGDWDLVSSQYPSFAYGFSESAENAYGLQIVSPELDLTKFISPINYYCGSPAITSNSTNFYYSWHKVNNDRTSNIEYTIINHKGNIVRNISKLTNLIASSTEIIQSRSPGITSAPNENVAIVWEQNRYNTDFTRRNSNVFFAILNPGGDIIVGPNNLTNNNLWGEQDELSIPHFSDLRIISTNDNYFVVAWTQYANGLEYTQIVDNFYIIIDSNGNVVIPPQEISTGQTYNTWYSILARMSGNEFLIGYTDWGTIKYSIIDSSGKIIMGT